LVDDKAEEDMELAEAALSLAGVLTLVRVSRLLTVLCVSHVLV
jgi:hypothetical protein